MTTAIIVNENKVRLLADITTYLTKLAPPDDHYLHNDLGQRPGILEDEPENAHSHLMAMTLGNLEGVCVGGNWVGTPLIRQSISTLERALSPMMSHSNY
jgi:thiamine phosphate synthase YjbQ (UPF0047 family)